MSELYFNRSRQGWTPESEGTMQPALRIRIDVPMGTPLREIKELLFRQAYQLAGTQLRAAIALGITPETVSRVLRRAKKRTGRDGAGSADGGGDQAIAELKALELGLIKDPAERAARIARRLSRFDDLFTDEENDLSPKAAGAQAAVPDA